MTPQDQQGFGGSPPPPGDGGLVARAQEQLNVPAILMMVLASLTILSSLYSLVMAGHQADQLQKMFDDPNIGRQLKELKPFLELMSNRAWNVIPLVLSGVVLFGAMQMRQVKSYGLSLTAAIITAFPLCTTCCCLFGMPIGIWAIVVLMKPEVKAAFQGR